MEVITKLFREALLLLQVTQGPWPAALVAE
jgi:hypothetical protein